MALVAQPFRAAGGPGQALRPALREAAVDLKTRFSGWRRRVRAAGRRTPPEGRTAPRDVVPTSFWRLRCPRAHSTGSGPASRAPRRHPADDDADPWRGRPAPARRAPAKSASRCGVTAGPAPPAGAWRTDPWASPPRTPAAPTAGSTRRSL